MSRYFFAVAPPEPQLGAIEAFRTRWGNPHHKAEPHITIKAPFLWNGDPAPVLRAAQTACARVSPFEVELGAPDRFRRNRVLFLTARGEGMETLHRLVVQAVASYIPPDPRGHEGERFHAHLTLAAGRFGISDEGIDAMDADACRELADLAPFIVKALRCYRWDSLHGGWQRFRDLPLRLV